MAYKTIISTAEVAAHIDDPDWAIIDCRFSLADTGQGQREYLKGHIPGAGYAHLDRDMCAPVVAGKTGRHPLPPVEHAVEVFSKWGIGEGVQVVAYDDWPGASGAIAARLWWMLRWLGHDAVAILDGGWQRWLADGYAAREGREKRQPREFVPRRRNGLFASSADINQMRQSTAYRILDARSSDRYRGENETIDPVAGHIPGAISAPYAENVGVDGLFLPPDQLHSRFTALIGDVPAENTVVYCGSGVTAAHNLVALAHAGWGDARLYVGSWSEWITDPGRPVAR